MTAFQELKLLTLLEAASILQISKRTLLRMIQQGEVPAFKVGGQWRIRESQFRKWVEQKENSVSSLERDQNGKRGNGINKVVPPRSQIEPTDSSEESR
jgi:excisionase family DNA binding protein